MYTHINMSEEEKNNTLIPSHEDDLNENTEFVILAIVLLLIKVRL